MAIVLGKQGSADGLCSIEEDDLVNRSSKKLKNGTTDDMDEEWLRLSVPGKKQKGMGRSFADTLQGVAQNEFEAVGVGGGSAAATEDALVDDDISESEEEDSEPLSSVQGTKDDENAKEVKVVSGEVKNSNPDVWRVVHKPNRRKKETKEKGAVNPHPAGGSRFGVLATEDDEITNVGKQGASAEQGASVVLVTERKDSVSDIGENARKESAARSKGKTRGKLSRKSRRKLSKKEYDGEVSDQGVQRLEKRGRDLEQSEVGKKFLVGSSSMEMNLDSDVDRSVSKQVLKGGVLMENSEAKSGAIFEEADPDGFTLDPGEAGLAVCSKNHPCLIFLAETKSESVERLRCVSKLGFDGLSYVPSLGRSGGILAAWNSSFIEVDVINLDRQLIHLRCRFPNEGWFFVTALYAIPDTTHKQILWSSLNCFASSMVLPWVVVGDFNDIASLSERTGGLGGFEARCSLFSDRIQACNLVDLGSVGPKFTWRGPKLNGGRRLFERLDRAIANGEFLSSFSDCSVQLLLVTNISSAGPLRLRYNNLHQCQESNLHYSKIH
ncbi:hypothetical protein K1719_016195 [Acacia pycnantha]|nr:hypothetical protein K1719_016195 [Acacia pycnantha]